ncbi:BnaCnng47260D [Brassica napus]|uniref:BnaCnng47260D protein n=1 Tax=Brassica napus TaxID=3708 RepID=A0A078JIA2_BRANA|nr:BnaCnng47260D [Brassica napus]
MAVKSSDSYARQREIGSLGSNLKKLNGEGLPEATVRRYTGSVLRGLRHIHANGFAHCDLKLRNILLCGDGAVKIADFGLAKRTEEVTASSGVQIRGRIALHVVGETFCQSALGRVHIAERCPFEFADWVSASSDSETQYRPFDSLDERIASLATDLIPDWSVTSNWVTVR